MILTISRYEILNIAPSPQRKVASRPTTPLDGGLALLLTCIGLYGLTAWTVQRRTSEIGIRAALGARRGTVIAMVIREALAQSVPGILIGIPATLAATKLIASQLYRVSPFDPRNILAAVLVLLLCIAVAGYLPARRASRIDPAVALRYE